MANNKEFDLVVVGSCVQDLISYTPRFPAPGESVRGTDYKSGFGGKGANQAVCASRLGLNVAMVAKLGSDIFGPSTIDNFRSNGVNADNVQMISEKPTATANIYVEDSGENMIVVVLGANESLSSADIQKAEDVIAKSKVITTQLEVPSETTLEALRLAKKHGTFTIFNPAPGLKGIPLETYKYADVVVPNENEAEILSGVKIDDGDEQSIHKIIDFFESHGAGAVVLTVGSRGCILREGGQLVRVPAQKVKAVDTVYCPMCGCHHDGSVFAKRKGAGDCFIGSLAYFCARYPDMRLAERVRRSGHIAALSVLKPGTQTSYPQRHEVPEGIL